MDKEQIIKRAELFAKSDIPAEEVRADYFDETALTVRPEPIIRITKGHGRVYANIINNEIKYYASVTTITRRYSGTSPFLLKWWCDKGYDEASREMKIAGWYGTFCHILFKDILLGQTIDLSPVGLMIRILEYAEQEGFEIQEINHDEWMDRARQDVIAIIRWIQDYNVKPLAIELTLSSVEKKYAGTLDLLAEINWKGNRIIALVDLKSNRKELYDESAMQLQAYLDLAREFFGDRHPVDEIFNLQMKDFRLTIGKTEPYRFIRQTENEARGRWYLFLAQYIDDYETFIPKKRTRIKEIPVSINSNMSEVFEDFIESQALIDQLKTDEVIK